MKINPIAYANWASAAVKRAKTVPITDYSLFVLDVTRPFVLLVELLGTFPKIHGWKSVWQVFKWVRDHPDPLEKVREAMEQARTKWVF